MIFSFLLVATTAQAKDLQICGNRTQGQILMGFAPDAKVVSLDEQNIKISENGKFLIALDRDAKLEHKLRIEKNNGEKILYLLNIDKNAWDIQNLTGVQDRKVTPSAEDQAAIEKEQKAVRGAQKENSNHTFWQDEFIMPVEGRISGKFGGQRIMNGVKKNPHMGLDIAILEGTPIKAPADGVVKLSGDHDFFYSGNMVILDHGHGLYTIYAHLLNTKAKEGDIVKKGDIIGLVGKTGRVTGAHLHWGASLNGTRFDPSSLTDKNNKCVEF